jgi:hypothetical protein
MLFDIMVVVKYNLFLLVIVDLHLGFDYLPIRLLAIAKIRKLIFLAIDSIHSQLGVTENSWGSV